MKKIYAFVILTSVLISCGEEKKNTIEDIVSSGTLKELTAKKKEIRGDRMCFLERTEEHQ